MLQAGAPGADTVEGLAAAVVPNLAAVATAASHLGIVGKDRDYYTKELGVVRSIQDCFVQSYSDPEQRGADADSLIETYSGPDSKLRMNNGGRGPKPLNPYRDYPDFNHILNQRIPPDPYAPYLQNGRICIKALTTYQRKWQKQVVKFLNGYINLWFAELKTWLINWLVKIQGDGALCIELNRRHNFLSYLKLDSYADTFDCEQRDLIELIHKNIQEALAHLEEKMWDSSMKDMLSKLADQLNNANGFGDNLLTALLGTSKSGTASSASSFSTDPAGDHVFLALRDAYIGGEISPKKNKKWAANWDDIVSTRDPKIDFGRIGFAEFEKQWTESEEPGSAATGPQMHPIALMFEVYALLHHMRRMHRWIVTLNQHVLSMFGNMAAFSKLPLKSIFDTLCAHLLKFEGGCKQLFDIAQRINKQRQYVWHRDLKGVLTELNLLKIAVQAAVNMISDIEKKHLNVTRQIARLDNAQQKMRMLFDDMVQQLPGMRKGFGLDELTLTTPQLLRGAPESGRDARQGSRIVHRNAGDGAGAPQYYDQGQGSFNEPPHNSIFAPRQSSSLANDPAGPSSSMVVPSMSGGSLNSERVGKKQRYLKSGATWAPNSGKSCDKCPKRLHFGTRHHCYRCGSLCCSQCAPSGHTVGTDVIRCCTECKPELGALRKERVAQLEPAEHRAGVAQRNRKMLKQSKKPRRLSPQTLAC
jgi:hypothetical protein